MSDAWPQDTAGAVFLARALDRIGGALFPDQWSGEELRRTDFGHFVIPVIHPVPDYDFQAPRSIVRLERPRSREEIEELKAAAAARQERQSVEITRLRTMNATSSVLLARRTQAAMSVIAECEAGRLIAYYLDVSTGEFYITPPSWWRAVDPNGQRFFLWGLDWSKQARTSANLSWIFVERASLDAAVSTISARLPGMPVDLSNDDEVVAILKSLKGTDLSQRSFGGACATRELRSREHPLWETKRERYRRQAERRWTSIERLNVSIRDH
jgi:hypothetical protein